MAIPKVAMFYTFRPVTDPVAVRLWQRDLCEGLGVRGRIIVSHQGINATVGGNVTLLKTYVRKTREYPPFRELDVTWTDGSGLDPQGFSLDFPRLSVKHRRELVAFGPGGEVHVDDSGVRGGGARLSPEALHDLVDRRGDEVVFFDGRNAVEAQLGHFRGAVVPDVTHTPDFVAALDSGAYDTLKDRPVVTYCTGGIRCEVLSALMRDRGFREVYQLEGGVVRYGQTYGGDGLWQGRLVMFDGRTSVSFGSSDTALARCSRCGIATHELGNRADLPGRPWVPLCSTCAGASA